MSLCLNMIVKNEERNLPRCLASVRPFISSYVICDTGSTDKTKEIILEELKGIPGEIRDVPFETFSQARNAALEAARGSQQVFSHLLLLDADMELVVKEPEKLSFEIESADACLVEQVSSSLRYENIRVVKRELRARYMCPTHEYIDLGGGSQGRVTSAHMIDHATGSNRVEKFERDEKLLRAELEKNPTDTRCAFYLAQTYKDMGRLAEACEWYAKRAGLGGWSEEVYLSHLYRGRMLFGLQRIYEGIEALENAIEVNPERLEAILELSKHYRERGKNEMALSIAESGKEIRQAPEGALFLESDAYRKQVEQEISIAGFYSKREERKKSGKKACASLTIERNCPDYSRTLSRKNILHYTQSAKEKYGQFEARTIFGVAIREGYRPMNPSLAVSEHGELFAVVRTVNYQLFPGGKYEILDPEGVVRTENHFGRLDPKTGMFQGEVLVDVTKLWRKPGARILGLEDMRLFRWQDGWWALATVRDVNEREINEIVLCKIEPPHVTEIHRLCPETQRYEKNWLPFVRGEELFIVYSTDPLRLLRVNPKTHETEEVSCKPTRWALDHLRGGTNVIPHAGRWVYLTHEVIAEADRIYLHRFIYLSKELEVCEVSEPFYLEKREIEYVSGLANVNGELVISYGVQDREAKIGIFANS